MSIGSCAGASAAAEEIIAYIEALVYEAKFKDYTPFMVAFLIQTKAQEIKESANAGWY
jgi:hypothetical protein